ncbi:hypothetical protein ACUNDY_19530 [Serratia sp. IR-2025]|uniref:hypothetical protein n=1 Tax=Serratia TaxID=613 RepID=UPI0011F1AEA6|nr:hypothetical protein [Serratia marcescens]QKO40402.1 hypothetical protein F0335_18625 [Serratia marcescens]HEJ6917428.1 hypothetical protein [Serratia marcescens]
METIVPIVIVLAIIVQAFMYARAVFIRRHFMLNRVISFIERPDASIRMKEVAQNAFEDALSVKLPIFMMNFTIRCQDNPEAREELDKIFAEHEKEEALYEDAREELGEIINMMFCINWKFNRIIFEYARWRTSCSSAVPVKITEDLAQEQYLMGFKTGHQH